MELSIKTLDSQTHIFREVDAEVSSTLNQVYYVFLLLIITYYVDCVGNIYSYAL